jgi:hypothetical protein
MRPKRFPLPVAFTDYQVELVKELKQAAGECDFARKRIRIAEGTSPENWRATLWHEFFHAVLYELGRDKLSDDEALVEGLAIAVMRVRTQVPKL